MKLNENERIDELNVNELKLVQNTQYFMFGIDSVLLCNIVKSNSSTSVILDLCTGSAVIPILLTTRVKYKKIIGVELQKEMYDLAKRNVHLNKLDNDIDILNEDIKNYKSIIEYVKNNVTFSGNIDVVVCNPPYKQVGTGVINENKVKYIARHEEKCSLQDVFLTSSKVLKTGGRLYLVHKPERLADLICIAREYNLEVKKIEFLQPTIDKKPSIVLLEYVKDGKGGLNISPIIMEYDKKGEYSKQIKKIYRMEENE